MWRKAVLFIVAVTLFVLSGCNPGSNSYSRSGHLEDGMPTEVALLTSTVGKELS